MTRAELVAEMARRGELTAPQARQALDAFVATVAASLKRGEEVRVVGFGNFVPFDRPPGVGRNPKTGAAVKLPAAKTARFRVSEAFKALLNGSH